MGFKGGGGGGGVILKIIKYNFYTKDTVLSVNTILNNLTVIVQNKLNTIVCPRHILKSI